MARSVPQRGVHAQAAGDDHDRENAGHCQDGLLGRLAIRIGGGYAELMRAELEVEAWQERVDEKDAWCPTLQRGRSDTDSRYSWCMSPSGCGSLDCSGRGPVRTAVTSCFTRTATTTSVARVSVAGRSCCRGRG